MTVVPDSANAKKDRTWVRGFIFGFLGLIVDAAELVLLS